MRVRSLEGVWQNLGRKREGPEDEQLSRYEQLPFRAPLPFGIQLPAENEGAQLGLPLNPYRISTQALREAIDKSVETCECCGKPGRGISSQYHWESVSCRDCREPTDTPNDPEGDALDTFTRYHACVERICALVGESAPEDTYEGLAKLEAILDQGLLGPKAK